MTEIQMTQTKYAIGGLGHLVLGFGICLEFRISCLGFQLLVVLQLTPYTLHLLRTEDAVDRYQMSVTLSP